MELTPNQRMTINLLVSRSASMRKAMALVREQAEIDAFCTDMRSIMQDMEQALKSLENSVGASQ